MKPETKAKISAKKKGMRLSKETKEKMRESAKKRWAKVREICATLGIIS